MEVLILKGGRLTVLRRMKQKVTARWPPKYHEDAENLKSVPKTSTKIIKRLEEWQGDKSQHLLLD